MEGFLFGEFSVRNSFGKCCWLISLLVWRFIRGRLSVRNYGGSAPNPYERGPIFFQSTSAGSLLVPSEDRLLDRGNMSQLAQTKFLMSDVPVTPATDRMLAIIMGGGAGTRLFPLTKERAKPAVPLGGKYRLVDIPISNCLNSGIRSIYVLTQFNSMSLHRHINAAFKFDNFSPSFVEILAAQQTPAGSTWYQGTADAVRQNLSYFWNGPSNTISFLVATSSTEWTSAICWRPIRLQKPMLRSLPNR